MKSENIAGKVNTLAELRAERHALRRQIHGKEADLKDHYTAVTDKLKPVENIYTVIRKGTNAIASIGNRKHADNSEFSPDDASAIPGNSSALSLSKVIKMALPLIAGRYVMRHKKKMILIPLVGYALKEGTKYLFSKSLAEHKETLRSVFPRNKQDTRYFM